MRGAPISLAILHRGLLGCVFLTPGGGCASPQAATPPRLEPAEAARQAFAEYDHNKDGTLDAKELERCPGLKNALKRFDKNNDGRLSAAEVGERLSLYLAGTPSPFSFPCRVFLDGQPLAGASVTFVPEKFLGATFKRAAGTTDESGNVSVRPEGQSTEGVFPGLYRVEISKRNAQGQETIPTKYNAQTVLGEEVAPDTLGRGGDLVFRITSR